jgi:hypothetical protein
MTDDERIVDIERTWRQIYRSGAVGMPLGLMTVPVPDMEFLLRVIRDQRAELTQSRQAITNMRKAESMK